MPILPVGAPADLRPVAPAAGATFRAVLTAIERSKDQLDAAVAAARGAPFSPQELLALQADAYQLAQTLDVASKVIEQGAQIVKQAVQAQV
jgi:hypothetical protein